MFRMAVYYKQPEDSEAFERRYVEGHLPLIDKYANIKERTFFRIGRAIMGQPAYSHMFVGTWPDKDAWKADMNSPEAKAATEDAASFATQGFDVVVLEELA